MRIRIAIPMNYYLRFEVIYNTSKIDLYREYIEKHKILSADIVNINNALIGVALTEIIEKIKKGFPLPCTYRLWQDNNMYIEETITE